MKRRIQSLFFRVLLGLCGLVSCRAQAEVVFYNLDHVFLDDGTQMTGIFSWTYSPGDFENGTGGFVSLSIPWTAHDQNDLNITFDIGSSIEFALEGNFHDDGVDVQLFLLESLTPTNGAALDLTRSKYDIGGNGFHVGGFSAGSVLPIKPVLSLDASTSGVVTVSWSPDLPGHVLQEQAGLSTNWVDSASGTNNPAVLPATDATRVYRLTMP